MVARRGSWSRSERERPYTSGLVTHLQTPLSGDLIERLGSAVDRESKIPRALEALGPTADRDVLVLDGSAALPAARLVGDQARVTSISATQLETPGTPAMDGSADVLVLGWSTFRGPSPAELAAAERWLRPGGRLLVVHDYGRDDVSRLRPERSELVAWSHRNGPFLKGGFRVHVVHCFWTFESGAAAGTFLERAFGEAGRDVAATLRRPRLSYNVAVYHRTRGGGPPAD